MTSLRTLAPVRVPDARHSSSNQRIRRAGFAIGLFAIIVELAISGNTLEDFGIDYSSPGQTPLVKLHPGTYLISLGAFIVLALARPPGVALIRLFRNTPALGSYIMLVLFCAFYSIANVGVSGAATYVDTFLSAGLLAIVLEGGTDRQKRAMAWWIIAFVVLSIFISIGESATQSHLIPIHIGETPSKEFVDDVEDFRGAGLFGHPLAAALTTSMAIFMLLHMRMHGLLKASLFAILMIGLLTFGGRAALGTTLIILVVAAAVVIVRGVVMRDLSIRFVGAVAAAVIILLPFMVVLVSRSDIGERIMTHLYFDDSADVRALQWLILNHLNLHDVLFGVSPARLAVLKYQIGLGDATTDIENFWLLMFLNLGSIGFVVFLVALALFIGHLGRTTAHPLGWMLMLAAILIDSTSNSLGRKTSDLCFLVACMIAMTGYPRKVPTVSLQRRVSMGLRRTTSRLATHPSHVNAVGFKS